MSMSATVDRGLDTFEAWPREKRRADTIREIQRASNENRLVLIKPGYFADTYKGMTKAEVREEIRKHNELAGDGK